MRETFCSRFHSVPPEIVQLHQRCGMWNLHHPGNACVFYLSLKRAARPEPRPTFFTYQVKAKRFYHQTAGNFPAFHLYFLFGCFAAVPGCLFPSAALCLYRRPSCCCCCCKYARRFLARRLVHVLLQGGGGISSAMLTMCQRRGGRRLFPIFGKSLSIAPPWRDGPPQRTRKYDGNPEADVRIRGKT